MRPRWFAPLIVFLWICTVTAGAQNSKPATPPPHLSKQTRMGLLRALNAELVYIRTFFPMGRKGLTLKDGQLSPSGQELQQLIALWGPSVKPGDQALISAVNIKGDRIRFEINGGPVKKKKWYQHIQINGGGGGITPGGDDDQPNTNPRGSYVDLVFDHYIPELDAKQIKQLLRPLFDFDAKSAVEAYLESVPPKIKEAIQNHHVLVGMNREMVIYAKGRTSHKIREKDGDVEWEEWIYGQPPQDVDFIRFVGDEVIRVETMKVDGQKIVRTEKEVDLEQRPSVAQTSAGPDVRPANAPTLRRPGEEMPAGTPAPGGAAPGPVPPTSDPGTNTRTGPNLITPSSN
jgi:hypothetical protein